MEVTPPERLLDRRLPRREAEEAGRLVELVRRPPGRSGEAWRWIVESGSLAEAALHLLERSKAPGGRKKARPDDVTGADVMEWLTLPPGPRIGELLFELAVAIASGQVKSRREARNWLTGQVQSASERL